jgi:O-methyltransferase
MIRTLQHHRVDDREIYLFDTFEGMTRPSEQDTSAFDAPALETWNRSEQAGQIPWRWAFDPEVFDFDSLRSLIDGTGYPTDRIHFVKGKVEDTLPAEAPPSIAVLRLDTDWYESTWHELVHLYPRLEISGVLIIDDYGHWDGCRKAVDTYFQDCADAILLARTDYTGRIGVKTG